jgi:hypothetical protein
LEHVAKARSHSRSGSRSPAFAKPMMALAIVSRAGWSTPEQWRAWIAVSNAMPKRRVVSGSNRSPSRYCLIGIMSKTAATQWQKYGSDWNTCRSGIRPKTQTIRVFFVQEELRGWGDLACSYSCRQSTLVTYTHWGHSYPIRPGPLPNGGICTTTVMTASHRGQRNSPAGLPSARSDTAHALSLQRAIRAAWVALQPWAQR